MKAKTTSKKFAARIMALLMAFALAVTVIPAGNIDAQAAVKKPGKVKKVTATVSGMDTVTFKAKKVKGATGYEWRIRVLEIDPQTEEISRRIKIVKKKKTKKNTLTLKNQTKYIDKRFNSLGVQYTVQVRAYKKSGGKTVYGKQWLNVIIANWASDPGKSKNSGQDLIDEYNRWITLRALSRITKTSSFNGKELDVSAHLTYTGHYKNTKWLDNYTGDKYSAYKSGIFNSDILVQINADILAKMGVRYKVCRLKDIMPSLTDEQDKPCLCYVETDGTKYYATWTSEAYNINYCPATFQF